MTDAGPCARETVAADCAAIVARDDPPLHATAMFAAEPARSRLMVLYAFDVELSRAAQVSTESLIPRMRLQWWRDTVKAARDGAPPPAHEVAGPFARLIVARGLPDEAVTAMIDAREAELEGGFDAGRFATWADERFGALTALAAHLLADGEAATVALARRAGPVLGTAFLLRHAPAMAAENRALLPGLSAPDRAALAGRELTPAAGRALGELAAAGRDRLAAMRADRQRAARAALPAFLPLSRAGRLLHRAARLGSAAEGAGSAGAAALGDADRPFDGLRLALRAATGRW